MTGAPPARVRIGGHEVIALDQGWEALGPGDARWLPACVPGTAAGVLRDAGRAAGDLDAEEWSFRTTFDAAPAGPGEEVVLRFGGLATLAEVELNGDPILTSTSMFAGHSIDVGARLRGSNELRITFRPLEPELAMQRRPRARWRTRLVADNNLRWFRTMLLGRIPSFSPGPAAVGPWRPVWLERRRGVAVDELLLKPQIDGADGRLTVFGVLRSLDGSGPGPVVVEVEGPTGRHHATLATRPSSAAGQAQIEGEVRLSGVKRWWPHTHGAPSRYAVRIFVGDTSAPTIVEAGMVGFRDLASGTGGGHDLDRDGLFVHVNGVPVFARGALWTPLDIVSLQATEAELRAALEMVVAAGMNMLRLPGFGPYEQDLFHDLCDELGILVWQDLSFASMDYPFADQAFGALAEAEVREVGTRLAGRPSSAVLCGNSEVEQQVAMLGLDLTLARIPFYDAVVPALAAQAGLDAVVVPSSPWGGDLPMRPDHGVTNYYGVGGYRLPLSDARTSGVRFASECLAFANIPDDELLETLVPETPGEPFVHHPRWKAGVPRDAGAGWDFDDLRDHYLERVYGVHPGDLRRGRYKRYLDLSRAVTGEVMAATFGEWRRAASPSGGGLILWLRDLVAGAAYGVVDHRGRPKTAWYYLARALAPIAIWMTDEGTGGVVAHIANDGPSSLVARLRIALYTDHEQLVATEEVIVEVPAHGAIARDVEAVLGRFVDASWAFRFGAPVMDVIVATLEDGGGKPARLWSQAFHFPAGWPIEPEPASRLGIVATARPEPDGGVALTVKSRRLAYGVHIDVPGFRSSDDAFSVEPGGSRVVTLRPRGHGVGFDGGGLTAINLIGRVPIRQGHGS